MVSDTLVLTVIYDRARTVLELINMETQWPEQGIGFVFPLAVLPLSVIFFHCHSASDFVLRLLPSLCNMAAAASSITPHTTVYKARKENIFFFFFFERGKCSQMTFFGISLVRNGSKAWTNNPSWERRMELPWLVEANPDSTFWTIHSWTNLGVHHDKEESGMRNQPNSVWFGVRDVGTQQCGKGSANMPGSALQALR